MMGVVRYQYSCNVPYEDPFEQGSISAIDLSEHAVLISQMLEHRIDDLTRLN